MNKIRKIPPVCLGIALAKLLAGRLKLSHEYLGAEFGNEDGTVYKVFRNIKTRKQTSSIHASVFIVSFKFARLSYNANRFVSLIPMLLIAGFPGFIQKLYLVNKESGYWQGMYEWESTQHLMAYKNSFVFRMMKKRAIAGTVKSFEPKYPHLSEMMNTNNLLKKKKN